MNSRIDFSLSYQGADADQHLINFYDIADALMGFERSLALTTHLVINGEVITQAPSLKGASIYALPPMDGSWKINAAVLVGVGTAIMQLNNAPKDTPIGNLVRSAYDFVISEILGFHVNFDETLGKQSEEYRRTHPDHSITESKIDSLIEKCTPAIRAMHRPIFSSQTATFATIVSTPSFGHPIFDMESFEYVEYTRVDDRPRIISGRISSYNINTFKGRIFSFDERRPIAFFLSDQAQDSGSVKKIIDSMSANALSRARGDGDLQCTVLVHYSRTEVVKKYTVLQVDLA